VSQAFRCPSCRHKFVPEAVPPDGRLPCPQCGRELRLPVASLLPPSDPGDPNLIGGYRILRKLGSGATANVFAADAPDGRRVALKILNEDSAADLEFLRRFRREADLARQIHHPNLVALYAFGHDKGQHFLAMELVEGPTLEDEIEHRGRIPWAEACEFALQVAGVLGEAAKHGIIHRDIKPANIMLAGGKVAKLADLGFGKQLDASGTVHNLTIAGTAMGSPAYMPPEQVSDAKTATPASDLYALGATLYHAVTGKLPFDGDSSTEVMEKVLGQDPAPARSLVPELPEALEAFLAWTMQKDQLKRPQTAEAFAAALREVLANPAKTTRHLRKAAAGGGGRTGLIVGVVAGVLVIGGVAAWFLLR
jgi:serine/threonine protein kinase